MPRLTTLLAFLLLLVVAIPGHAQLAVRAVTRTGLQVTAGLPQTVPPNTDITAGRVITSSYGGSGGTASATTAFALTRTDRRIEVILDEQGAADWDRQSPIIFPAASVGLFPNLPPDHGIDLELTSVTPLRIRLTVTTCNDWGNGYYEGTLAIPGHGLVRNAKFQTPPCDPPETQTFEIGVGATPTVLSFLTRGLCQSSRIIPSTGFHGRWVLNIENASPCNGLAYDRPCGAMLGSHGTLALPGTWIELLDASRPAAAVLLAGTQRLRFPFHGCFLLTDFPVVLPFGFVAPDRAMVYVPPLPFPVLVTTQALTLGPAGLHGSNGLELQCR